MWAHLVTEGCRSEGGYSAEETWRTLDQRYALNAKDLADEWWRVPS
ncbi:hypothetical protein ACNKHT_03905 [Shigella flexneri]